MSFKRSNEEARYETGQDADVCAALDDVIAAIQLYGRENVKGEALLDTIDKALRRYQTEEIEPEGLDGVA